MHPVHPPPAYAPGNCVKTNQFTQAFVTSGAMVGKSIFLFVVFALVLVTTVSSRRVSSSGKWFKQRGIVPYDIAKITMATAFDLDPLSGYIPWRRYLV